jgi:hypothetical protein
MHDKDILGLRVLTLPEIEAKVDRILKARAGPGWTLCADAFRSNPRNARTMLEHSHFRNDDERLMFARCYFTHWLAMSGEAVDPNELHHTLLNYEVQMQRQRSDLVVHSPPTAAETQKVVELRQKARAEIAQREAERVRQKREELSKRGFENLGTTIGAYSVDRRPAGLGLRVPVAPDAVKGIHDWDSKYATYWTADTRNAFYSGRFTLLQICMFTAEGKAQVYVYYVYDTEKEDMYAVGPDALGEFARRHGDGYLTAKSSNVDGFEVPSTKGAEARELPAAPDAFAEPPQIYYAVPRLPVADGKAHPFMVGRYRMRGYLRKLPGGSWAVLFYVAENMDSESRPELVVGPRYLRDFSDNVTYYGNMAWLAYPREPGAMPPAYVVHSVRGVMGTVRGDPEMSRELRDAWISAAKDPMWWAQVAMGYAGAAQPEVAVPAAGGTAAERAVTTEISASIPGAPTVLPSGGNVIPITAARSYKPPPSAGATAQNVGRDVVYVGGGAARQLAPMEAPLVSPAPLVTPAPSLTAPPLPGLTLPLSLGALISAFQQAPGATSALQQPQTAAEQKEEEQKKSCRRGTGGTCPAWQPRLRSRHAYWDLVYQHRRGQNWLARSAFRRNLAVLVLDGAPPIIESSDDSFHSEQLILWRLESRGIGRGCPIRALFSERKPCQRICQKDVLPRLCRLNQGRPFDVFYAAEYYRDDEGVNTTNNPGSVITSYLEAGYIQR